MKKITKNKLQKLYNQGNTQSQIADILNKEGYRTAWGNEFDRSAVGNAARKLGLRRQKAPKKKRVVAAPVKDMFCRRDVVMKLLNADIDNASKADILEAIYK